MKELKIQIGISKQTKIKNNTPMNTFQSIVESKFVELSGIDKVSTKIPYIVTSDFPKLGLMTALRFIEWVAKNPEGVISLPTDEHADYFINFTHQILDNWKKKEVQKLLSSYGLTLSKKPELKGLHFVQSDEFYPISQAQLNSAFNYVKENYIEGFGLKMENSMLINSDEIKLFKDKTYKEVFPDCFIDLSLRYREAKNEDEEVKNIQFLKSMIGVRIMNKKSEH
jgi:hypothetical protein